MDFKYILDDADLSVGLSVTCSTTTDDSYCGNGPYELHHEVASTYPSFMINYTPENIPPSNSKPGIHIPEFNFSQSFIQSEIGNSLNHCENLKSNEGDYLSVGSNYELVTNKIDVSRVKNIKSSSLISKNEHSEGNKNKMQVCKTCRKSFKFQTSLLRHNNKVHFNRYQCLACCRVFSRQSYLDVHTSKPGTSCFIRQKNTGKKRKRKSSCL